MLPPKLLVVEMDQTRATIQRLAELDPADRLLRRTGAPARPGRAARVAATLEREDRGHERRLPPPAADIPICNPGDVASPDAPDAGETLCPHCSGKGKHDDGSECPVRGGTGKVVEGIGGG